jgi:guanine nucleotide-binding protein G(i) subunit alpha
MAGLEETSNFLGFSDRELRARSKQIEAQIKKDKQKIEDEKKEPRVLILGASDSGKSTLLKQLRILHGGGFQPDEISQYKLQMYQNILSTASTIVSCCTKLDLWPSEEEQQV